MSRLSWQRTIDQIILTGSTGNDRILGLTSLRRESGVSLISRYIARTLATDRQQVLLLDLSNAQSSVSTDLSQTRNLDLLRRYIVSSGQAYDVLTAQAEEPAHGALVEPPGLRELLQVTLADYARVVIDLPPVLYESALGVNSVAASAICDRLMLVTRIGRDKRGELTEVVSMMNGAGIQPSSLLANEF